MEQEVNDWTLLSPDGEVHQIPLPKDDDERVTDYTVLRLQMKIWNKAFKWVENKVIHSNTDIRLFNDIQDKADELNQVYIIQSKLAEEYGLSRNKIATFLKSLIDVGFIHKKARGVYTVNPFVFSSQKAWSNGGAKGISKIQKNWWWTVGIPPTSADLGTVDTLIGELPTKEAEV